MTTQQVFALDVHQAVSAAIILIQTNVHIWAACQDTFITTPLKLVLHVLIYAKGVQVTVLIALLVVQDIHPYTTTQLIIIYATHPVLTNA